MIPAPHRLHTKWDSATNAALARAFGRLSALAKALAIDDQEAGVQAD